MKEEKCIRGFHWTDKAYYARSLNRKTHEIMFGIYHNDGGTTGEMAMRWVDLSGKMVP
jgi:hypothetical protein